MATVNDARRLLAAGRWLATERLCQILLQQSRCPPGEIHHILAQALTAQSRHAEALILQRRVARAQNGAGHWHALGMMAQRAGEGSEAAAAWREALTREPGHAEAACALAQALMRDGRTGEARAVLSAVSEQAPEHPQVVKTLGWLHGLGGDLAWAEQTLDQTLSLAPDDGSAWYHLGLVRRDQGNINGAVDALRRAADLMPDFADARFDLGQMLMLLGNFASGWPLMEWRHSNLAPNKTASLPSPGPGRIPLTVCCEQGAGDTLQYCRFLPRLTACGYDITLICSPLLAPLLASLPGVKIISLPLLLDSSAPWPEGAVGLLSLPYLLDITEADLPGPIPYLIAPPRPAADAVEQTSGTLSAGLVWAGNPEHRNDRNRSCPLQALAPLFTLEGVRWYSLQKGAVAAQAAAPFPITDLAPLLIDYADTAAAMNRLDLIVTVDTSTAHLAGALGRPTFLLLPHIPDWRWMQDRPDTPWYPQTHLFRQSTPGDWADCVERVGEAVRMRLDDNRSCSMHDIF